MQTIEDTIINQKTRELCQTILNQPEFGSIRNRMDAFMASEEAKTQYQLLTEKGDAAVAPVLAKMLKSSESPAARIHALWLLDNLGKLEPPVTLAEVKQSKLFEEWALVRQSRLSTMAVPESFVKWTRKRYPDAKI